MEKTEDVVEITDPEVAQLILKLGALQDGDWVRFSSLCYKTVSISEEQIGRWHQIRRDSRIGVWECVPGRWVFHQTRDYKAVDGWRRKVKQP
jgi:hypothetical protein